MFRHRITILRIAGIPIRVDASWIVILLLITWSLASYYASLFPVENHPGWTRGAWWLLGAVTAVAIFICLVLHELGHALVAQAHGIPIRSITLFVFGGVAEMEKEPSSARSEFFVAGAGPVVSVALAGLFALIVLIGRALALPAAVLAVLGQLAVMNVVLVAFNLLPAFPLDGGRVVRAAVWACTGNLRRATAITARMGSFLGGAMILLGMLGLLYDQLLFGLWWLFLGWFLQRAAQQGYEQVVVRQVLEGEPVGRFMTTRVTTVPPDLDVGQLVKEYVYTQHHELYPVVHDGCLLGYVTLKEIKRLPHPEWPERLVGEIMESRLETLAVSPDLDALEVLGRMQRTGQTRLLVIDRGKLAGIVTLKDLLAFLSLKLDLEGESAGDRPVPKQRADRRRLDSFQRKEDHAVTA
jgi:Zn-dependent protease